MAANAEDQAWVKLVDVILGAFNKDAIGIQAAADSLESALRATDILYDMDIDSRQVWVRPA